MRGASDAFGSLMASLMLIGAAGAVLMVSLVAPATPFLSASLELVGLVLLLAAAALGWRGMRETRDAVAASRRSEARQRAIVDQAGEAILVIDDRATIHSFNRAAERMFGYSADEVIGTSLERLMTEGG